jgi:hypothetical protein
VENFMKKYTRIGASLLLLSTIPSFALHAESRSLIRLNLSSEIAQSSPFIQKLFTEDNLFRYDAVIELIESIENDTLGPCTPEDEHQISEFIACLARSGLMPDAKEDQIALTCTAMLDRLSVIEGILLSHLPMYPKHSNLACALLRYGFNISGIFRKPSDHF